MSNKQQLQLNNEEVASLIEILRGKTSGGGRAEACAVALVCDFVGGSPMPLEGTEIYYTDANMTPQNVLFDANSTITISVAKNTIVFLSEWSSASLPSGNIVAIAGASGYKSYWVKGDGTLTYRA